MSDANWGAPDARERVGILGWRTRDFVVTAALAVPLGIIWSYVWGQVWLIGRGILPDLGIFLDGFYVVAGVLVMYVVRRPGAALLGEMIAALIEIPLTPFGAIVLWLGFLQGIGTEAVFAATGYRRFGLPVLMAAGALGSVVMLFGYEYFAYGYLALAPLLQLERLVLKIVGGAIFAGVGAWLIGDALAATGVLNNFPIGRARREEV